MVEKRLGKQSMNKGLVFLLIFLIALGIVVLYTKLNPNPTGFVTNIPGGSVSSYNLSDGSFNGTKIDNSATPYSVVVDILNNHTAGTYTSPLMSVPSNIEVVWNNFVPNATMVTNSTITYLARVCSETNCSTGFSSLTPGGINLVGKYFQYEVLMGAGVVTTSSNVTNETTNVTTTVSTTTTTSPIFYGVDMTYLIPIALSISIDNPQNTTYDNESIPITVSTTNASAIWFSADGGSNEIYTGATNKVFSQGAHSITAYANDTNGHLLSKTISFTIVFPEPYCGDGVCGGVEVCANCPLDCGACSEENTDTSDLVTTETCTPDWQCDDWSDCVDGTQTRACTDVNACGLATGMPDGTQTCVVQSPDTSSQTTTKKGFLGTVGSVITAPVTFVFGNRTRIFIFVGALFLAIVGFFAYRTFVQGKKFPINFKKFGGSKRHSFDNMLE